MRRQIPLLFATLTASILAVATPVHAQAANPPAQTSSGAAAAATQAADNDDGQLDPAEPDYSVINLPTTLRLPRFGSSFHLTHRFNENLRGDDFGTIAGNLFGIDQGASISLEYRFGVMRHVEAVVQRNNLGKTIQFSGKWDAIHQSPSRVVSVSGLLSVEGNDNFQENHAPAVGAVVSRTFAEKVALYATPVWVGNSAGGTGIDRNTFYLGMAGRFRVRPSLYLIGEVSPRLTGYVVGDAEYGFGVEGRVGAHVFSLVLANTQFTTYRQLSHGGNPGALYFGFNLTRKFF